MVEDFTTRIKAGAADFAMKTLPASADAVRARGAQRQRQRRRTSASVAVVAVLTVVAVIGVGYGRQVTAPPGVAPSSATNGATATPTTSIAPPNCDSTQITITLGRTGASGGHSGEPLIFKNIGSVACRLTGYPTVELLDAEGRAIAKAEQTPTGWMGGSGPGPIPVVDVSPGQSASALFEGLDMAPDGRACPASPKSMSVTLPGDDHPAVLAAGGPCSSFKIHPIVRGESGGLGATP